MLQLPSQYWNAYHLRQLEKRFDALNRVQLAYIAGRILDD